MFSPSLGSTTVLAPPESCPKVSLIYLHFFRAQLFLLFPNFNRFIDIRTGVIRKVMISRGSARGRWVASALLAQMARGVAFVELNSKVFRALLRCSKFLSSAIRIELNRNENVNDGKKGRRRSGNGQSLEYKLGWLK